MLYEIIESFRTDDFLLPAIWVTLANIAMFVAAIAAGQIIVRRLSNRRITPDAGPLTRAELTLAGLCVALNALVAIIALLLWRGDLIALRPYGDYNVATVLLDTIVLFLAMDLAMYVFHRAAHHPVVYALAHRTHHDYESPRPLTLFVLNPIEVLGFGVLWLVVLALYTASIEAILAYLAINVVFGLTAHLGVEPAPGNWLRLPLLRYVSTSTFHAEHHADRFHNFGFYLTVWDRLFGTLSPQNAADFGHGTRPPPMAV